ncbi:MAG: GntR family transcriptional regulator [Actinomycetota bacterium]|nr:GntR family transcriptional regulator [Actinomycetota bacterium]
MGRRDPSLTVRTVHRRLRDEILSGRFPFGAVLPQVQLAERYGVSRTPLREALRLLEEEGLIYAESNHRARVAEFRFDDLEAISAQRIMMSAVATAVSVPQLTEVDIKELRRDLELMEKARDRDAATWKLANTHFHNTHMSHAPLLLRQDLERLSDRNALYRSVWARDSPHSDPQSVVEHMALAHACEQRDGVMAAHTMARHQARIAIAVMAGVVPEQEPATIRAALNMVLGTGRFMQADNRLS